MTTYRILVDTIERHKRVYLVEADSMGEACEQIEDHQHDARYWSDAFESYVGDGFKVMEIVADG